jgi:hypothetical protein
MNSAVTGTFSALIPPGIRANLKWRLAVSISIMGLLVYALWSLGLLGLSGFARADDVKQLQQRVDISAQLNLATEIRVQVRARCAVTDSATKESITRYIDDLQRQYKQIAGDRYPEAPCQ